MIVQRVTRGSGQEVEASHVSVSSCPSKVTLTELRRLIGKADCDLRDACLHLGLHQHGTRCPHLAFLDVQDKLRD